MVGRGRSGQCGSRRCTRLRQAQPNGRLPRECAGTPARLGHLRLDYGEGRKGGSETRKFVYKIWPDQIFPIVNFGFPRDGHFGLEGGGGPGG